MKVKCVNFVKIGLSLIFLFNPNVSFIDLLPDFIGYIILCSALVPLADMNETVSEALSAFKKMIIIDASKIIGLLWVFGVSVTTERNSSMLLWAFVFGILEILFAIPAFIKLFNGLLELGYLHENTSVFGKKAYSKQSYTDKIKRLTVFFITFKAVLSFLPEFASLTSSEYYENYGMTNMYRFIGIMRFLAFVPVFIIGIVWIVKVVLYFARLSKDRVFLTSLDFYYENKVSNKKGIFIKRTFKTAGIIMIIFIITSFDFRLENLNVIPDFISAVLLFAFFAVLAKRVSINKYLATICCCMYLFSSVWVYITELRFFNEFTYGSIYRSNDAMRAFNIYCISSCINIFSFVMGCILVIRGLKCVIDSHTGVLMTVDDANTGRNIGISIQTHKELCRYLIYCVAATAFYAVTDVMYTFMAKDYGFLLMINTVGAIIATCVYIKAYIEISEAINSRYILE